MWDGAASYGESEVDSPAVELAMAGGGDGGGQWWLDRACDRASTRVMASLYTVQDGPKHGGQGVKNRNGDEGSTADVGA